MKKTAFLIALVLMVSCTLQAPDGTKNELPSEVAGTNNSQANESSGNSAVPSLEKGDLVSANFVLMLEDGTVVDTNNEELADKYNLTNYVKGTFTFILGQSGKVPGFDDALLGLKVGEHKDATIEPSEKELVMTINRTRTVKRYITLPRNQGFPRSAFEKVFNKKPVIGDVVSNPAVFPFKYQITNMSNKTVVGKMLLKEGETYQLPNTAWNSSVVKVAEQDAIFFMQPYDKQEIETPFGKGTVYLAKSTMIVKYDPELNKIYNQSIEVGKGYSIPQQFQVIDLTDEKFTIKRYGLLTDKRLSLSIDILNATKNVKEVRAEKHKIVEVEV